MNKKLFYLLGIAVVLAYNSFDCAYAITNVPSKAETISVEVETDELEKEDSDIIRKISLKNKFKRSPEAQIENFYKKYNRYSQNNDIKKLKEMYSDIFANNDGFDKDTIFKLMQDASSSYKNVVYDTEIQSIDVNELYATVTAKETSTGETTQKAGKIDDYGAVSSELVYKNYLRKENGKWKITAAEVISETISLKYGEAKKTNISMQAPRVIPAGSEYEAKVRIEAPDGCFVVGSIVNEQIKYPQANAKDVLRAVKSTELARLLTANSENHNEYATISLGITRPHVELPSVVIDMTGMAIMMQRVNVIQKNNVIKTEKENVDGKTLSEGR